MRLVIVIVKTVLLALHSNHQQIKHHVKRVGHRVVLVKYKLQTVLRVRTCNAWSALVKLTETQCQHVTRVWNVLLVKNRAWIVHLAQIVNANHVMQENSRKVLEITIACNAH